MDVGRTMICSKKDKNIFQQHKTLVWFFPVYPLIHVSKGEYIYAHTLLDYVRCWWRFGKEEDMCYVWGELKIME
jgi:hypothetical protein